jgi:hypothetical protein
MGAFSSLGSFLGGYAQARRQKHIDKMNEHSQMMNEAKQWADIADNAKGEGGDAVREMATQNFTDLIEKYEKSAGEKNGLSSVLKLFKKDKTGQGQQPAIPAKLAEILKSGGQQTPAQSAPSNVDNGVVLAPNEESFQQWYKEQADKAGIDPNPDSPLQKYDYRSAYQAGVEPQIDPSDGQYHWDSRFKADDHPNRFVNGVDTKTGEPAPGPSPLSGPEVAQKPTVNTVSQQPRFPKQYAGGTRLTPTWAEMEKSRTDREMAELRMKEAVRVGSEKDIMTARSALDTEREKAIIASRAMEEFENNKKMADYSMKLQNEDRDRRLKAFRESSEYAHLNPMLRERAETEITSGVKTPQWTAQDLEITGPAHLVNGKVHAENRAGQDMVIDSDWRKENKDAATYLDMMPADKKSIEKAQEEAAKFKVSEEKARLEFIKSQAERNRSITDKERDDGYKQERFLLKNSKDVIRDALRRVDEDWNKELARMKADSMLVSPEEQVTGIKPGSIDEKNPKGIKSTRYPDGKKDDKGVVFKNLGEYEDYYKAKIMPYGLSANRARTFLFTDIDPMGEISGSYQDQEERRKALGLKRSETVPSTTPKPAPPSLPAPPTHEFPTAAPSAASPAAKPVSSPAAALPTAKPATGTIMKDPKQVKEELLKQLKLK